MNLNLTSSLMAGGSAVSLLIATIKLLYNSLKDERQRAASSTDRYLQEIERLTETHDLERQEWQEDKALLRAEIQELKAEIRDLYQRIYKYEHRTA